MTAISDDFVAVSVPKAYVMDVYELLVGLAARDEAPESVEINGAPGWTEALIERQFLESSDTMRDLQKTLAAQPDKEFTGNELADAIGMEYGWNSVAGMLGAAQRRIENRYGRTTQPFTIRRGRSGQAHYSMTPEVAAIIARL